MRSLSAGTKLSGRFRRRFQNLIVRWIAMFAYGPSALRSGCIAISRVNHRAGTARSTLSDVEILTVTRTVSSVQEQSDESGQGDQHNIA